MVDPLRSQNYSDITHLVKKAQKKYKDKESLEISLRWTSLISIFIIFFLLLNPNFNQGNRSITYQGQVLSESTAVQPVNLTIPVINVNADIERVGVTQAGEMEVPNNAIDVGWFDLGPRPGERGSAVIAGHFNGKNGEVGVFTNLDKLKIGDKLFVEDDKGNTITFVVRESRIYDPGYANDVFNSSDGAHLNLVTCDGVWDGTKKSYSKRLVVFTDIIL